MFFIFYLSNSVVCTLSYDIPVQYKKIVLYKQDFITEIKSPSYAKRVFIIFDSLPSKISGSVYIKIFDLHETYMEKFGIFLFVFIKFLKRIFAGLKYLRSVERIYIFCW